MSSTFAIDRLETHGMPMNGWRVNLARGLCGCNYNFKYGICIHVIWGMLKTGRGIGGLKPAAVPLKAAAATLSTSRHEIPGYDLDLDLYCANLIGSLADETQLKYVEVTLADELLPYCVFTNRAILGLTNVYAGTLETDRMALRGELAAFTWDETTDYDTNVDRFQRILARLEAANDTTSEADRVLDFLYRVPHRFSAEVNAILTALPHQPERYATRDSYAYGRDNLTGDAAIQTSERACHYCHVQGHMARECRNKQSDINKGIIQDARLARQRTARSRKYSGARRRLSDQAHHVGVSLFLVEDATPTRTLEHETALAVHVLSEMSDNFLLDSGASSHLTGDRSLLHDVHPVERSVAMADGHTVLVTQAGTLRVRGKHGTVDFSQALLVENLAKTLLSVLTSSRRRHTRP
ncbi:hypothetical protein ACHHYP_13876 [Achlya hypogyna]|uniref:CCHC-type domain-containing protein n=1 Tax=Achlya hypogyna TaxID=1202772 RepID=A0A1V9YED2_ACHHY|nr:hypothetical protein ACHHYP_13876 [Achlya hypogyna]